MRDSFLELYRKARYKGRIVPQRQFSLLSLVFAMHTKQQAVSFVTRGEQSSDHPAADRVEAGQDLILVPPGEQWLFVKPSPCDSQRERRIDLVLGWQVRKPRSHSHGRHAVRFIVGTETLVL